MLLLKKDWDGQTFISIGQICLVLGLIGLRITGVIGGGQITLTFWNGFLTGLAGGLMGLSVVMNIAGLIRIMRHKREEART